MTWMHGPSVAFDLETTGTDVEQARIVTAAVIFLDAGEVTETWTALADPGVEIPVEASAVHGVSTERARAEGRPAGQVIAELLGMLAHRSDGAPLIVMNAPFDLTVLDREARRHGLEHLLPVGYRGPVIDPLVIARHLLRYERGPKTLGVLCERYGIRLDNWHAADADAFAAARLARTICAHGRVVRRSWACPDLPELERQWDRVRRDAGELTVTQPAVGPDLARQLCRLPAPAWRTPRCR